MRDAARVLVVAGPPIVLAGFGLTHPVDLTPDTAPWWTTLHILLIPVFPLLGVAHWLLVRGVPGLLAGVSRVAAFGYVTFYTALDVLAGVATGTLVQRGVDPDGEQTRALFAIGNELGTIGSWCFLVACVTTGLALFARAGRAALPGAAVLVAAAVLFLGSHIYVPVGVSSMVLAAIGFGLLAGSLSGEPR